MEETLRSIAWWTCMGISAGVMLRAASVFTTRRPARARLVENGYRRARDERRRATFHKARAPMPLLVQDLVEFVDHSGGRRRAALTRLAIDHSDAFVIWYDAAHPARVSAWGPHNYLAAIAAAWASYFALTYG